VSESQHREYCAFCWKFANDWWHSDALKCMVLRGSSIPAGVLVGRFPLTLKLL